MSTSGGVASQSTSRGSGQFCVGGGQASTAMTGSGQSTGAQKKTGTKDNAEEFRGTYPHSQDMFKVFRKVKRVPRLFPW